MKKYIIPIGFMFVSLGAFSDSIASLTPEKDTAIESRNVVVERTYNPTIQSAGKINIPPVVLTETPQPIEVECSFRTQPLKMESNFNPLACSPSDFSIDENKMGHIDMYLGYIHTGLDFGYQQIKNSRTLNLFAQHQGQWSLKMKAHSKLGANYTYYGKKIKFFSEISGAMTNFSYYGRYFNGKNGLNVNAFSDFTKDDKENIFQVSACVGIGSMPQRPTQWRLQVTYRPFIVPDAVVEHNVMTWIDFNTALRGTDHFIGLNLKVQNSFMSVENELHIPDTAYNTRHAIRLEPFYHYAHGKMRLHIGVNIDVNIGSGKQLAGNNDVSFSPSPNVKVEYDVAKWFTPFAKLTGYYDYNTVEEAFEKCLYANVKKQITNKHLVGYSPFDVLGGFHIRPLNNWLVTFNIGYGTLLNQNLYVATAQYIDRAFTEYRRWTAAVETHYHYKDIFKIYGKYQYLGWKRTDTPIESYSMVPFVVNEKTIYDHPEWEATLRLETKFTRRLSMYLDNQFSGKRTLLTIAGDYRTKATIDLNAGMRFDVNRWFYFYGQINNYINRKNDLFYGYQTMGINGLIGMRWIF